MADGNSGRLVSTVRQKIETLVLIVPAILHIIGFSLARWNFSKLEYQGMEFESSYHVGLWQHCVCVGSGKDKGQCHCFSRTGDPAWFKVVQAMETLGLIGLVISGITTLVLLRSKRSKRVIKFNVFLLISSGLCIIIGLIIFETLNEKTHGNLGISFVLCVVAAGLCMVVWLPLFAVYRQIAAPQVQQGPVQFSTLSQIISPSLSNQPQVMITTPAMQQGGTRQLCASEQYNAPPPYEQRALPAHTDMQPLLNEGMPPKL